MYTDDDDEPVKLYQFPTSAERWRGTKFRGVLLGLIHRFLWRVKLTAPSDQIWAELEKFDDIETNHKNF